MPLWHVLRAQIWSLVFHIFVYSSDPPPCSSVDTGRPWTADTPPRADPFKKQRVALQKRIKAPPSNDETTPSNEDDAMSRCKPDLQGVMYNPHMKTVTRDVGPRRNNTSLKMATKLEPRNQSKRRQAGPNQASVALLHVFQNAQEPCNHALTCLLSFYSTIVKTTDKRTHNTSLSGGIAYRIR